MKRKHIKVYCLAVLSCFALSGTTAVASTPYQSYVYNAYKEPVYSPDVYQPARVLTGEELGIGSFNEPQDLFEDSEKNIYITDTKNSRIVCLNPDFSLKNVLDTFQFDGKTEKLNQPQAVFVDKKGFLYISDTGNRRILTVNQEGRITRILTKPSSEIFPQDKEFLPEDLVVNSAGVLYTLVDGIYQGAVVFNADGSFGGYYGANQVQPSLELLMNLAWKRFATKEQRSKMSRFVPIQYSAIAIDDEDFVYATVATSSDPAARIKKLNPMGNNILTAGDGFFGDPRTYKYRGATVENMLSSVTVLDGKYITVLDRIGKKVFQYTQEGKLLNIFGGSGYYQGAFLDPVSVCGAQDGLLVLDAKKNNVTVFSITGYGKTLHTAIDIYTEGLYQDSVPYWDEILKMNSGSTLANLGYGKAMYQIGEYKKAMDHFKLANEPLNYSDAFKQYRKLHVREYFRVYAAAAVLVVIVLILASRLHVWQKLFRKVKGMVKR